MKNFAKTVLTGALVLAFGGLNVLAMDLDPNAIMEPMNLASEISEYSEEDICFDNYGSYAQASYSKRGFGGGAVCDTYMDISFVYDVSDCDPWTWANIHAGDVTKGDNSDMIEMDSGRRICRAEARLNYSDGNANFAYHSALLNVSGSQAMSGSYDGSTGTIHSVAIFPVS